MRPTHIVLGAALVLGSVAPIAAQDLTPSPSARLLRVFSNEDANRAALGISTGSTGKRDTLGLLIESVTPGSPADKAGLLEGYRIASINGENLKLAPADAGEPDMDGLMTRRLSRELGKVKAGDEVTLQVYADGAYKTVKVKTVALEDLTTRPMRLTADEYEDRPAIGISLDGGGSRRDTLGLLVTAVETDGPADKAGIEEGNRIAAIDSVDLRVPADEAVGGELLGAKGRRFTRELEQKKAGDEVTLKVYANGAMKTVTVKTARAGDVYKNGGGRRFRINIGDGTMMAPMPPMPPMPAIRLQRLRDRLESIGPQVEVEVENAERAARGAELMARRESEIARVQDRLAVVRANMPRVWSTWDGGDGGSGLRLSSDGSTVALGGLRMSAVSRELSSYFGKGSENGLLVLDANDDWRPLQAGDVILSVNGKPVRDGDQTSISLDSDRDNTFVVLRKGTRATLHVKAH